MGVLAYSTAYNQHQRLAMKNLLKIIVTIGLGYVLLGLPACGFIKKDIEKVNAPKVLRPTKSFLDSLGRSLGQQLAGGLLPHQALAANATPEA